MRKAVGARNPRVVGSLKAWALAGMMIGALAAGIGNALAAQSAAIVVDAKSGKILFARDVDARTYPASLTKMMTLYLLFEALDSGRTTLDSRITMSAHAADQAPSKLGLKAGQSLTVREAILAVVTRSANDVAVAIGEYLGGSEGAFADRMTRTAHEIGMSRSNFENASGLPNPGNLTTARDMATLGRALQDRFPRYFAFFSTPSFVFQGRRIGNHNHLLGRIAGVNGIKTGYTRASGFNLVTSVDRDNRKLVAVVLGGTSGRARDQKMASLIQDYLPAATAGVRTAALVGMNANAAAAAPIPALPAAPTRVASAADADDADPVPTPAPRKQLTPAPAIVASVVPVDTTETASTTPDNEAEGDDDAADSTPVRSPAAAAMGRPGWKIQIGASPTKASATALLGKASSKAKSVLGKASGYTETVSKGHTKLYRARFAGFRSKESAEAACKYLSKHDFACMALKD